LGAALGAFLLALFGRENAGRGGRVDNVDYPSWARACNCGQCGQPKNKLSRMSTNKKGFWEKEKGGRGKAG